MNLVKYSDYLGNFLKKYLEATKASGYILGVSGGIDSAVVAGLLKKYLPEKCYCLVMPIHSSKEDGELVCKELDLPYQVLDLTKVYDSYVENTENGKDLSLINLKVRLRMVSLYYYAQTRNMLVIGTDNKDEYYTGYFTKFGDGAYDVNPLRHLTKGEVRDLAKILNINQKIIDKKPSADLIDGICDEDELKVSYDDLDNYLKHKRIPKDAKKRIKYLHKISQHKRKMPVFPKPYK